MTSSWTVGQVMDRVRASGVVPGLTDDWPLDVSPDTPFDYFGKPDGDALVSLLEEFEIVYFLDHKSFPGPDVDDESRLAMYRQELEGIAEMSRGLLAITDVELVDVVIRGRAGRQMVQFRCNGDLVQWGPVTPGEDEDVDAVLAFMDLGELAPKSSPERWCQVTEPQLDYPAFIFADPAALTELGRPFGLRVSV